jgi:hypothetical protein
MTGSSSIQIMARRSRGKPAGEEGVTRIVAEAKVTVDALGAWAEVLLQNGRHVTDFPYAASADASVPGRASGDNRYVLTGAEYGLGPVTIRYNISLADYSDVDVSEVMHVPAVGLALNDHLSVLAEYVHWTRDTNGAMSTSTRASTSP